MVASVGSSSGVSNRSDSVVSRLDTRNQGTIDKSDLAGALSATADSQGSGGSGAVDSDGKVAKSELSEAMTKVSDQLNAQFDASRVQGGMAPQGAGGPPGGGGGGGGTGAGGGVGGAGGVESSTSTTSTDYVAAADTDGDGTISDAEQAAYDKKLASGEIDKDGNSTASAPGSGDTDQTGQKDATRELAHALHMLKAYGDDGDASAASTGSVNVDA